MSHLSSEVLQDGRAVDGCCCSHSTMRCGARFEMSMDTTDGEL